MTPFAIVSIFSTSDRRSTVTGDVVTLVRSAREPVLHVDRNIMQGWYGESYVSLIAASAGLTVAKPFPDVDGIDLFVNYPKARSTPYRPQIDVQVKTVCTPDFVRNGAELSFTLPARHFNELAGKGFDTPRYLIVVHVPTVRDDYIHWVMEENEIRVRHRGYWVSLKDHDPLPGNGQGSMTVRLPVANVVTPAALLTLMMREAA
ncbi:DUF4365 domain-containing protein [Spongiactinospora sp. TRM90649]|uniref:DUF4365 domain-containing protein n=1 Tax=Spongiactinospora sp. TRM90649 TaxID=3031114 RepID=UPI0023F7AE64|nr:DUF4365 domain-containing protein [Spongiactinospora sp. TRM90649]MDF5755570.1 DUF4365 domain-containing protein [Spongiactinospora sp. TRM90649]